MEQINRLIAHKLWLNDLRENNFVVTTGEFESNYILLNDKKISRINVIANVVNKFQNEDKIYVTITIDDSSAQIRLKTWREDTRILDNINIGDIVLVIGKIKRYNDEVYILPEIVKKVSPNEELLRKLELIKEYGLPQEPKEIKLEKEKEPEITYEEINFASSNLRNELLNLIEKNEENLGIALEEIKTELHSNLEEVNKILEELIKEGQVYEVKGRYRLLL
ncbi:MAG: OB-fold nucleic acid binding domain-containing protein [Nanoarchaeota archaeon]